MMVMQEQLILFFVWNWIKIEGSSPIIRQPKMCAQEPPFWLKNSPFSGSKAFWNQYAPLSGTRDFDWLDKLFHLFSIS
jgi:hypothetical protein